MVTSYQQTIRAYPKGGGSYIVASENLGTVPGLVAGASILTDYVLTVAVSVSAGVAALTSAFPALYENRVWFAVAAVAVIAWGNLRGVRESGTLFAAPVYLYLGSILGLLAFGFFRFATGDVPAYTPPPDDPAHSHGAVQALGLFLILRAFSSGAVGLTGTEAVADGVGAFKRPEARNARIVLSDHGHLLRDRVRRDQLPGQLAGHRPRPGRGGDGEQPAHPHPGGDRPLLLPGAVRHRRCSWSWRRTPPSPTSPAWPSSWPGTSSSPATSPSAASAWPSPTGSPSWPRWPPC